MELALWGIFIAIVYFGYKIHSKLNKIYERQNGIWKLLYHITSNLTEYPDDITKKGYVGQIASKILE